LSGFFVDQNLMYVRCHMARHLEKWWRVLYVRQELDVCEVPHGTTSRNMVEGALC